MQCRPVVSAEVSLSHVSIGTVLTLLQIGISHPTYHDTERDRLGRREHVAKHLEQENLIELVVEPVVEWNFDFD